MKEETERKKKKNKRQGTKEVGEEALKGRKDKERGRRSKRKSYRFFYDRDGLQLLARCLQLLRQNFVLKLGFFCCLQRSSSKGRRKSSSSNSDKKVTKNTARA